MPLRFGRPAAINSCQSRAIPLSQRYSVCPKAVSVEKWLTEYTFICENVSVAWQDPGGMPVGSFWKDLLRPAFTVLGTSSSSQTFFWFRQEIRLASQVWFLKICNLRRRRSS